MTNVEKEATRDLVEIAEKYANIYEPRYRSAAKAAFLDGMTFVTLVNNKTLTPEQITEELCRRIRETTAQITSEV